MRYKDELPSYLETGFIPKKKKIKSPSFLKKHNISKKWVVIICILIALIVIILICRPYIRIARNALTVKNMFSEFKVEAKYQANDFINDNKEVKGFVDKLGLDVGIGQIKGEKKDNKMHGYVYLNNSNEQICDFYLLPEDITLNLKIILEKIKEKGGIMGGIISILPFEDEEFISLKKVKALKPDFKFEQPRPVIERIAKQVIKNFRNDEMPKDSAFKDEISDYNFYKTKVEKINIVMGMPKKVEKEKVTIYSRATLDKKTAEILAVLTKINK